MGTTDDPLTPRLRLFLSVDVVGSTAFKQSHQAAFNYDEEVAREAKAEPWFSPIAQFYREVERLFAKEWNSYVNVIAPKFEWPCGEAPQLWKSAGDELLYTKVLSDHREALVCISCWVNALQQYRRILREKYPNLDLKSGAWLAGFPITNTEVMFRSSVSEYTERVDDDDPIFSNLFLLHEFYKNPSDKALNRDFIGPSIDTGFRLCTLASPRRMIVSVDLALMLVHALRGIPAGLNLADINVYYHGRASLKGVFGGIEYPIFWVDMKPYPDLEKIEDTLLKISKENTDNVKHFCEVFISENPGKVIIPYIENNQDGYFKRKPQHHEVRLQTLKTYWKDESSRRDDETKAFSEVGGGESVDEKSVEEFINTIKE